MANFDLSKLRDRLELIANIPTGDAYIDGTEQLDDLNLGYEKSAYRYNWPQTLKRDATIVVAHVGRYSLPSDFRKFRTLTSIGSEKELIEFNNLKFQNLAYAVDEDANDFVLSEIPATASTAYTMTNGETAANDVVVELDTIDGLTVGEEIWIDNTGTNEFTDVSATDSANTTITIRLKNSNTASDILYKTNEIITYQYYRTIILLASSSDKTILVDAVDYIIPQYAAYLYFVRNQQQARAEAHLKTWQDQLQDAWLSHDKLASGHVGQMTV